MAGLVFGYYLYISQEMRQIMKDEIGTIDVLSFVLDYFDDLSVVSYIKKSGYIGIFIGGC